MGKKMLRSVLVVAFSAVVALGALSGLTGEKGDVRADTSWPAAPASANAADDTSWPVLPPDGNVGG
jgi:hypothetical protein